MVLVREQRLGAVRAAPRLARPALVRGAQEPAAAVHGAAAQERAARGRRLRAVQAPRGPVPAGDDARRAGAVVRDVALRLREPVPQPPHRALVLDHVFFEAPRDLVVVQELLRVREQRFFAVQEHRLAVDLERAVHERAAQAGVQELAVPRRRAVHAARVVGRREQKRLHARGARRVRAVRARHRAALVARVRAAAHGALFGLGPPGLGRVGRHRCGAGSACPLRSLPRHRVPPAHAELAAGVAHDVKHVRCRRRTPRGPPRGDDAERRRVDAEGQPTQPHRERAQENNQRHDQDRREDRDPQRRVVYESRRRRRFAGVCVSVMSVMIIAGGAKRRGGGGGLAKAAMPHSATNPRQKDALLCVTGNMVPRRSCVLKTIDSICHPRARPTKTDGRTR